MQIQTGRIGVLFLAAIFATEHRALAQGDIAGEWRALFHEDIGQRLDNPAAGGPDTPSGAGGPRIGDYTGLPINDAGRLKAESWDPRIVEAKEHQTIAHPGAYWILGAGGMRISTIVDADTQQLVAIKIYRAAPPGSSTRMIWMDGRAHPPAYAAHTWWGFSTGHWNANASSSRPRTSRPDGSAATASPPATRRRSPNTSRVTARC